MLTLLLVKRSSSPCSFRQEQTCPPCKLIYIIESQKTPNPEAEIQSINPKIEQNEQEKARPSGGR